jgi:hypothetical protein
LFFHLLLDSISLYRGLFCDIFGFRNLRAFSG